MEGAFELSLGGKAITCPPLTLGQVKRICMAVPKYGAAATEDGFEAEVEIMLAALWGWKPTISREEIDAWTITRRQMLVAVVATLRAAGLLPPEELPPGEAQAASA